MEQSEVALEAQDLKPLPCPTIHPSNFITLSRSDVSQEGTPVGDAGAAQSDNKVDSQFQGLCSTITTPQTLKQVAIEGNGVAEESQDSQAETLTSDEEEPLESTDEHIREDIQKPPILRLKKVTLTDRNNADSMTFEKQDASKNDSYCWVCHDGGDVLCCDRCPRVFHVQCSGLPKAPEGDEEWFCPVCKNIAKKTKRSRPQCLKDLLLLACSRMKFPGTELFQRDVPDDLMLHYKEYIFFPMHIGKIEQKVKGVGYQSTREFLHDTEWILHNCIIYNGAKHALTKIAKGIIKVCKEDMREIELCASCYKLTVQQPEDWFAMPCYPPHRVVLAKVRGYPLWPAKLISETSDKCDVRFFGQHDRSLVPKSCIQPLSGPPPTPTTKTQHWQVAMYELQKYRQNINAMLEQMGGGKPYHLVEFDKIPKLAKEAKLLKPKDEKQVSNNSDNNGTTSEFDFPDNGDSMAESISSNQISVSNHIPCPPQLVVVSNHDDERNTSGIYQGNDSISEPSSPGSEPELQIDLGPPSSGERRGGGGDKSIRVAPSASRSLLGNIKRTVPTPMALNFTPEVTRTTTPTGGFSVPTLSAGSSSSYLHTPTRFKRTKPGRPGEALSDIATSLVRRVAQLHGQPVLIPSSPDQGVTPSPTSASRGPITSSASPLQSSAHNTSPIVPSSLSTSAVPEDHRASPQPPPPAPPLMPVVTEGEQAQTSLSSQFSSIYPKEKTAIAVVDPDQKRVRKRKGNDLDNPPPTKKPIRIPKGKAQTQSSSASQFTLPIVTMATAVPSVIIATSDPTPPPQSQMQPLPLPQSFVPCPSTASAMEPAHTARMSSPSNPQGSGTPKGAKRMKSMKPQVKQLANLGGVPSSTGQVTATATTNTILAPPSAPTPPESVATPVTGQQDGEGEGQEEDLVEGSGLLADTIRQVDRTFKARMDLLTGQPGDLGFKYFTEKLMTSIKTVLIEMLSTFEAKSKMGAKQLKEQLHMGWPVPSSQGYLEQLRKELKAEMRQQLEVVRASAALEREQVVNEVRRQSEAEKDIAISETKKKKWCSYCWKEAQYNCCWNANYCNEQCQQAHWTEHMKQCTQLQQMPPPRTPVAASESGGGGVAAQPSNSRASHPQAIMSPVMTNQDQPSSMFVYGHHPPPPQSQMVSTMASTGGRHHNMNSESHLNSKLILEQQQHHMDHSGMESEGLILPASNPTSPPHHIRNMLLGQGQGVAKREVITGGNPVMLHSHGIPLQHAGEAGVSHTSSGGLANLALHSQQGQMSPAVSLPSNTHSMQSQPGGYNWSYSQPVLLSDGYPHHMMPTMQASSSQAQAYFKPF